MNVQQQYDLMKKLRPLGYGGQYYFYHNALSFQYATLGITQEADKLQKMFPDFRVTPFPNQQEIEFKPK